MSKTIEVMPVDTPKFITAATLEGLKELGEFPDGTQAFVGNAAYVRLNGEWLLRRESPEETPQWMIDWFEEGKKLGVKNEERSKEELDMLKECIIGASFIHKYCRDKELPTAIIDMVICETAMRWYEKDYETKISDPMEAPQLPAYHVHVTKFIEEFSAHIKDVRNAVENGTFDEELNLKVEDNK